MEFRGNLSPRRSRVGLRTVPGAGAERVLPLKVSKKRSFPRPRGGQDAFRGKAFGRSAVFPSQVLRQGAGRVAPPRNASPAFGRLRRPPAALRAAPRVGAYPVLQTSPRGTAPPRHKDSFASRPARALSNRFFVKQSPRVYPRNCYITHFQYPNAFLQHFRIPLHFVFPAPTFPPVGAGRGYSRRETESPSGRTFSDLFSFRQEKRSLRSKNK